MSIKTVLVFAMWRKKNHQNRKIWLLYLKFEIVVTNLWSIEIMGGITSRK
jgi:hypothetical protein